MFDGSACRTLPHDPPQTDAAASREAAAVLAVVETAGASAAALPALLLQAGGGLPLLEGRARLRGAAAGLARSLAARVGPDDVAHWATVVAGTLARSPGSRLLTLTEEGYPANLRSVPQPPLYLFVRGDLRATDRRAVAVVGSRDAGDDRCREAAEIASQLVASGVTVVSGLAAGIDAAAHAAALRAGGRTVGAIATGIDRVYPPANAALAAAIPQAGALVSRQWPDAPPTRRQFRLRNAVTSGLSLATVVVEAGATGGARLQARLTLEQRRRLVLLAPLVRREAWARRMAAQPDVHVAEDAGEVLPALDDLLGAPRAGQLSLF